MILPPINSTPDFVNVEGTKVSYQFSTYRFGSSTSTSYQIKVYSLMSRAECMKPSNLSIILDIAVKG